jgi:hypothetical protein
MSENITAPVISPTLRERIEKGAAWLNKVKPEWRDLVDISDLDLASGFYCVLGQVFHDEAEEYGYADGFDYAIGYVVPVPPASAFNQNRAAWMEEHGFDLRYVPSIDYRPLTATWQRYLTDEI